MDRSGGQPRSNIVDNYSAFRYQRTSIHPRGRRGARRVGRGAAWRLPGLQPCPVDPVRSNSRVSRKKSIPWRPRTGARGPYSCRNRGSYAIWTTKTPRTIVFSLFLFLHFHPLPPLSPSSLLPPLQGGKGTSSMQYEIHGIPEGGLLRLHGAGKIVKGFSRKRE